MDKEYVFWKNDTYPYVLWGELVSKGKLYFTVKGYAGYRFLNTSVVAIIPEVEAQAYITKLSALKTIKQSNDRQLGEMAFNQITYMRERYNDSSRETT